MSYKRNKTDNPIKDLINNWSDFYHLLPNLINAEDPDGFLRWFEKLSYIDRRSLYLCIQNMEIKIPKEYKDYVYSVFKELKESNRLAELLNIDTTSLNKKENLPEVEL